MRNLRWGTIALLLAVVGIWIMPWGAIGQGDAPVVRLGGTISETGSKAAVAALYIDGRALGVETINASGGINVAGTPYQIELIQFDDQSDADLAVRTYQDIVETDKADLLLGPYSSGLVIPTSVIAEQFQIPMVEGGGASSNIFDRGYRYVFGTLPKGQDYLMSAINLFSTSAGAETMALIYADDAFSIDVAAGARSWAAAFGLEITVDEQYSEDQTEFGSLIAKIKDADVDVIMGANHLVEVLAFVQQAESLDLDVDMVFTVGVSNPDFIALGDIAENVFGVATWVPSQAASGPMFGSAAEYSALFEDRFGEVPEYHNASATIEILTYKYAIEAAGSLDPTAVRDALAGISFDSFYGKVEFGENGQIIKEMAVLQIQNGQAVGVDADTAIFK